MTFKATDINRIWNDVYDNESLRSDPDVARNLADSVKASLSQNNLAILQEKRNEMIDNIKYFFVTALYWLAGALVLLGICVGLHFAFAANNHDYAGYGPQNVGKHNIAAINSYVLPRKIILQKRERGNFAGTSAWESQYSVDGKVVCVYVWSGQRGNYSHVTEGGC